MADFSSRPESSRLKSSNLDPALVKKYRTLEKALIYEFIDDHVELRDRYLQKSVELHQRVFGEPNSKRASTNVFPRVKSSRNVKHGGSNGKENNFNEKSRVKVQQSSDNKRNSVSSNSETQIEDFQHSDFVTTNDKNNKSQNNEPQNDSPKKRTESKISPQKSTSTDSLTFSPRTEELESKENSKISLNLDLTESRTKDTNATTTVKDESATLSAVSSRGSIASSTVSSAWSEESDDQNERKVSEKPESTATKMLRQRPKSATVSLTKFSDETGKVSTRSENRNDRNRLTNEERKEFSGKVEKSGIAKEDLNDVPKLTGARKKAVNRNNRAASAGEQRQLKSSHDSQSSQRSKTEKKSPYEQKIDDLAVHHNDSNITKAKLVDHHLKNSHKESILKWLELKEIEEKEKENEKRLQKRREQQKRNIEINSRANREAEASLAYSKWFKTKRRNIRAMETTLMITQVDSARQAEQKRQSDESFQNWLRTKSAQKRKDKLAEQKQTEAIKREKEESAKEREKAFEKWLQNKEKQMRFEQRKQKLKEKEWQKLEDSQSSQIIRDIETENASNHENYEDFTESHQRARSRSQNQFGFESNRSAFDEIEPEKVGNVSKEEFEKNKFEENQKEIVLQKNKASELAKNARKKATGSSWDRFYREDRKHIYERPKSTGPFRTNIRSNRGSSKSPRRPSAVSSQASSSNDQPKPKPKLTYSEFVKLDAEKRQKAIDPDMSKEVLEQVLKERKEAKEISKRRVDTGLNIQRRDQYSKKRDQNLIDSILKQGRPEPQGAEKLSIEAIKTEIQDAVKGQESEGIDSKGEKVLEKVESVNESKLEAATNEEDLIEENLSDEELD